MRATPSPNSNGPPLTRKATLEIYTVARSSQDLPPGCFTPPPGVVSDAPWVQNTPRGVCKHPRGVVSDVPPGTNHPRVRVGHCPGVDLRQDARVTMSATL